MTQINERFRHHDTLTYRHPRNTLEAFGCDAESGVALRRYRKRQVWLAKWLIRAGMLAWVILMVIGLTACGQGEAPEPPKPSTTVVVAKHEDCTVFATTKHKPYETIYWVRCKADGDVVRTQTRKNCGKNCTKNVATETVK